MLLKKSKKIVLIVIAIVAILVSFIGGRAYAKYMSKVTGNGTADVASWSFKVNENAEKMQTISLKSTINNSTLVNNKIAPGTAGTFQIKVDATGADVGINYNVKFENESKKPTNLKFEYDGKTFNSNDNEKIKTITIAWNWKYETGSTPQEIAKNDKLDTDEAKQIKNYTFDVIVSGTQVMPQS